MPPGKSCVRVRRASSKVSDLQHSEVTKTLPSNARILSIPCPSYLDHSHLRTPTRPATMENSTSSCPFLAARNGTASYNGVSTSPHGKRSDGDATIKDTGRPSSSMRGFGGMTAAAMAGCPIAHSYNYDSDVRSPLPYHVSPRRLTNESKGDAPFSMRLDGVGMILEATGDSAPFFGFPTELLAGMHISFLVPAFECEGQSWRDAARDGHVCVEARRRDGTRSHLELYVTETACESGQFQYDLAVLGASEHKAVERCMHLERQRLEAVLNLAQDAIITIDTGGIVRSFNSAAERIFMYSADEVIGRNVKILMPPQYAEHHDEYLSAYLATGRKRVIGIGREVQGLRKDGTVFPMELTLSEIKSQTFHLFTGFVRDLTQRARMESEIALEREKLQSVLDLAVDAIITINTGAIIQSFNKAAEELFGYSAQETIGQNVKMLMPAEHATHHDDYVRDYLTTGMKKIIGIGREVRGMRRDGSTFPMELSVSEVRTGTYHLFTGIIRDITAKKERDEEMRRLARMEVEIAERAARSRNLFFANVSHEIKTPLNGIVGIIQMLEAHAPATADGCLSGLITAMKGCGDNLLRIVEDVLDFSKIGAEHMRVGLEEFDLVGVVESVVALHSEQAFGKGLELYFYADPPSLPPMAVGDPARVRQVLSNLLTNAIKFTVQGHVSVRISPIAGDPSAPPPVKRAVTKSLSTTSTGSLSPQTLDASANPPEEEPPRCREAPSPSPLERLLIEVHDTGIGISPEDVARVFAPFEQADGSLTKSYHGTGLGLAICDSLVTLLGGELGVRTEQGSGSTFWFTLPGAPNPSLKRDGPPVSPSAIARETLAVTPSGACAVFAERKPVGVIGGPSFFAAVATCLHPLGGTPTPVSLPWNPASVPNTLPLVVDLDSISTELRDSLMDRDAVVLFSSKVASRPDRKIVRKPVTRDKLRACVVDHSDRSHSSRTGTGAHDEAPASTRTVLVAEDNRINMMVVADFLKSGGYTALRASNGVEVCDVYAAAPEGSISVVLMDLQMPVRNGLDAAREIRKIEAQRGWRSVPIVALTASTLPDVMQDCLQAGMDNFVAKPIKRDALLRVLERTLGGEDGGDT